MTRPVRALFVTLLACCGTTACSPFAPHARNESTDPDVRLATLRARLAQARAQGPRNDALEAEQTAFLDAGRIRAEVARFTLEHPGHVDGLVLDAQLAYEAGETERAAQVLDRVLARPDAPPQAAVLRGRIALEHGNAAFARKLLARSVDAAPDHAELRETYAAALYLGGDADGALRELEHALRLGAPEWRVQYHRGLVAEKRGDAARARAAYEASVEADATSPAAARLRGL